MTELLHKLVTFTLDVPSNAFAWGLNDCCTYAASWLNYIGTDNPYKEYNYTTRIGAMRVLRRKGLTSFEDAIEGCFVARTGSHVGGLPGDLASIPSDDGQGLSIALGGGSFLVVGHRLVTATPNRVWSLEPRCPILAQAHSPQLVQPPLLYHQPQLVQPR